MAESENKLIKCVKCGWIGVEDDCKLIPSEFLKKECGVDGYDHVCPECECIDFYVFQLSKSMCESNNIQKISATEWKEKQDLIEKQTNQLMDETRPFVRCGCLKKLWVTEAYKCLYCGQWFCKECAEEHFGKTVEQYRAEHPIVISDNQ